MYYSKQIYSPTRKLKKVITRFVWTRWRKFISIVSDYSPKVESKIQSLIPVTKTFLGNNWLAMLKSSFTVLTLLVFSYVMIYAENFQDYDKFALDNGSGLDEQTIKTNSDVAIDLESVVIDESDDIGPRRITYTIKRGDTPSEIARQFGITTKNLKLVNGLTSDRLKVGSKLIITPVEWFVAENKLGDVTIAQYAAQYGLDRNDLKELNDYSADTDIVRNGYELFIPLTQEEGVKLGLITPPPAPIAQANVAAKAKPGSKVAAAKPKAAAKKVVTKGYYSRKETASYLWFANGNCTSFVARKRPDVGKAIRAAGGGHAKKWLSQAVKAKLSTGKKPVVGAVGVQWSAYGNGYGHVGIVTSFDDDEVCMNNANVNGYGVVSQNCFPRSSFLWFIY